MSWRTWMAIIIFTGWMVVLITESASKYLVEERYIQKENVGRRITLFVRQTKTV